MDLGIVVVSFNTRDLTRACLASVFAALEPHPFAAHVWVVDNASADRSAEMVRTSFPQATLIASGANLGFARGSNLGLQAAARAGPPRAALLLNPDTQAAPEAIARLYEHLLDNRHVGMVGARLSYGDGAFQHGAFRFPSLAMIALDFWPLHYRLIESRLNGRYPRRLYAAGQPFPIDHPLGAAMMVRWEVVEQVGMLNEAYFMYCEEIDWCLRIRRAGWHIHCVPAAHIVHHAGQATCQFRDRMFVALWRSRYRLFEAHYSRAYQRAARLIVRAGLRAEAARARRALAAGRVDREDAERRLAAYREVMSW